MIAEAKNDGLTLQHFLVWLKFAFCMAHVVETQKTIIKISIFHTKSADCVMIESQSAVEGFPPHILISFPNSLAFDRNLLWLMISMPVDFMFSGEKKNHKSSTLNWNETERTTIFWRPHISLIESLLCLEFQSWLWLTFDSFVVIKDSFLYLKLSRSYSHCIKWSSCHAVSLLCDLILALSVHIVTANLFHLSLHNSGTIKISFAYPILKISTRMIQILLK